MLCMCMNREGQLLFCELQFLYSHSSLSKSFSKPEDTLFMLSAMQVLLLLSDADQFIDSICHSFHMIMR